MILLPKSRNKEELISHSLFSVINNINPQYTIITLIFLLSYIVVLVVEKISLQISKKVYFK